MDESSLLPPALRGKRLVLAFWLLTAVAVLAWATFGAGWDVTVYKAAIESVKQGHDPYADSITRQTAYFQQLPSRRNQDLAFVYSYVYSPVTLPVLKCLSHLPPVLLGYIYWCLYGMGALAILWIGMQAVEVAELPYIRLITPLAIFFPAMLVNGAILSGNVAFIVYGITLSSALIGWRHQRWMWFYVAVLLVSCLKTPYLVLLAIPVLSQRRQWVFAGAASFAGLCLVAVQFLIWPSHFSHFLRALNLQMLNFRDFGCSPAGMISNYFFDHHLDPITGGTVFYVVYSVPLFAFLVLLSRKYLEGSISLSRWQPVLLVGVLLLSPRIQEYDLFVLSFPWQS